MPTYEYECKKCGCNFEVFQAMSDEPLKTCTKCGSEVRRLICGGAGVIFKGSGFYVTDKSADKTVGKNKGTGAGGKTSKTESKPAETSGTAQSTSAAGDSGAVSAAKSPAVPAAQSSAQPA